MEEHHDKGFKIFGEDEPQEDTIIPREVDPEPIEASSSSSKPVFVAVLAFCILGGLLFFGYYQLSNRINRMESTGTHEIKGLNREVDTRLTTLSGKVTEQNAEITERIDALAKQLKPLARQAEKNASALAGVEKSLNTSEQSASSAITGVEDRMAAVVGRLDRIESSVEQTTSQVNGQLTTLEKGLRETRQAVSAVPEIRQNLQALQSRLDEMAAEFETLRANRIEPDNIRQEIASLDRQINSRLVTTENRLQKTISSLGDEVDALEAMMKSFKNMANPTSPGRSPSGGQNDIIEQEIQ